jgi:DNA end-binding protein Ku
VILRAAGNGIMLHTMFYRDEIREAAGAADESLVREAELAMAMMLVDQKTATFDAAKYQDGFRANVQSMIQAKIAEIPSAKPADAKLAPVVDIMDAIRKSIESGDKKPVEPASKKRAKKVGA